LPFVGLACALATLACFVEPASVLAAARRADPAWLAVAVLFTLLAPVIVGAKVWCAVRVADLELSYTRCWSAVMAGVALNAVTPGRGGDLARASFLASRRAELPVMVGVVLLERLADVGTLGLISLAASAVRPSAALPWAMTALLGAATAVGLLAVGRRVPYFAGLGERVGRAAAQVHARPRATAGLLTLSALSWVNNGVIMGACLHAMGARPTLLELASAVPIAILAGIAPLTVGGIGTRDGALAWLLAGPRSEAGAILAGGLAYTALTSWLLALLGVMALGRETLRSTRLALEGGPNDVA
jgi:uncharacterized membrane protein YbhN (UPF0104 family)